MAYDKNSTCEIVTSRILAMHRSYNDRSNPYLAGTLVFRFSREDWDTGNYGLWTGNVGIFHEISGNIGIFWELAGVL